ncbi:cytosine permease [Methanococcus maripaludis]|uniref:Cytosine permease n=1 Tax=Methanococcus maripaludis TaxID=39152 RepID=A0A2L1C8J5_METMI|nr:cytosine permease [Methanococcus maripaludis]AVB75623.1 Cytosine permease [Methanococcus maripaludis]MBA2863956.1 cytosine permease [Methanococcus maripaludis]MBB6496046.1 cytosine permease [Methanococcus maripaludis]
MYRQKHADQDYALETVPSESKKGFLPMFAIMLGFTFFSASMWAGGTIGTGLKFQTFLLIVLMGNLLLGLYTGALAYIGSSTGLSTHLLARYSFGEKGSYLASFILAITQVGWFGVGVAMFSLPVHYATGIDLNILLLLSGILMTTTAYFGIKSLTVLSMISVPAITLLGIYSVTGAVNSIGGISELFAIEPANNMGLAVGLSLCIGSFISGGTLTPDFARFSKSKSIGVISTFIAFFIGNSLMFIFGAVGASTLGHSDISEVMLKQGLIIPAIIILGVNIWTTNDNALYASGLGFSNITKIPKKHVVIFNGLIGTLGALILYNNFVGWLTLLSSIIPSIGGIIISDYFINKRQKYASLENIKVKKVHWNAVIAWVLGIFASQFLPGISPINAVFGSAIIYVVLETLSKNNI